MEMGTELRRAIGRNFLGVLAATLLASVGLGPMAFAAEVQEPGYWTVWSSESYTMYPRESFQVRLDDSQIQTRRWVLVVDGGEHRCDLSVLRVKGEELVYYKTDHARHEVSIPWGQGEEVILVITNRNQEGTFLVEIQGPPRDQNPASYSYPVNRALEAFASGQRLRAQELCRSAIMEDHDDAVAKVLLAGFLKEGHSYGEALGLVQEARQGDLPEDMRILAASLEKELVELRAPLPREVQLKLTRAEQALQDDEADAALEHIAQLLDPETGLEGTQRARVLVLKGRALTALGRNFEAIDAFTQALSFDRSKEEQAFAYYYMGSLFLEMGNLGQAEGALSIARQNGLPTGLDLQAREKLKKIDKVEQ